MAKSFNTLMKEMANGPNKPLFVEMQSYCGRNGLEVMETFFGDDTPPRTVKLWEDDAEIMTWIADRVLSPKEHSGRRWFYKEQPREELAEQSIEVVSQLFLSSRDDSAAQGGYFDYRIINHTERVVQPLAVEERDRYRDIATTLAPVIARDGYKISTGEAKIIWDLATVHGKTLTGKPKLCAQPDYDGYCLHRISILPASGPMPTTEAFLDRINDREAFAAWCYGVYSERYVGRQIMWLRGNGSDGKSTFFKAFSSLFGNTAGSVDWNQLKHSPSFAGSLFVNKRFVYIPDNNNPELLSSGLFKSLSDPKSDPVVINHKFGKMYSTELEAHTAVLSNPEPNVRDETHSLSRCLYLVITPRDLTVPADKGITEKFRSELPAFLEYGRECYERRCLNNTEITLNEDAQLRIVDRIAATEERWQVIFDENFVLEPEHLLSGNDVYKRLTEECHLSSNDVKDFRTWLGNRYGVEWKQVLIDGARPRRYIGMRFKTSSDLASPRAANLNASIVSNEVA